MGSAVCFICGWHGVAIGGGCPRCGSEAVAEARRGAVVRIPAGMMPCPHCGTLDDPIVFRAWIRLFSLVIYAREMRAAGYMCVNCARKTTAGSLLFTGLLGWWAFQSFFFYAPRATIANWRAMWTAPRNPAAWGAIRVDDLAAQASTRSRHEADAETLRNSPLSKLGERELNLVLAAVDVYETLGVRPTVAQSDLRQAYIRQAKLLHPDLHDMSGSRAEAMVKLNLAWEVVREPELRAAYDWLQANREPVYA